MALRAKRTTFILNELFVKKRALEKACARKSVRSKKRACEKVCPRKSVPSKKRTLEKQVFETFLAIFQQCAYSYAAFGFDRFIGL